MHPQTVHATDPSPHQAPLAAVRAAVLGRRIKTTPSVVALLGELCFGTAGHDRALATPALLTGTR